MKAKNKYGYRASANDHRSPKQSTEKARSRGDSEWEWEASKSEVEENKQTIHRFFRCIDSIIPNGFARNKKSGKNGIKKKNEIAKKMEKIIPVSAGEEIKRPLAREKNKQKLMSTW